MKQKVDVLMEAEELRQVKDELTQEMTSLNSDLEKERSKVHALKCELDKLKVSFLTSLTIRIHGNLIRIHGKLILESRFIRSFTFNM